MKTALLVSVNDDYGTKHFGPFESFGEIKEWGETAFKDEKGWDMDGLNIWVIRTNPYTNKDERVEVAEIRKIDKGVPTYCIRDGH